MEDTFENMKKLFNAENCMKAAERQKIERSKRDQLKEFQRKERERLNLAVKALRDEREQKEIRDDHLEHQKAEVIIKHRKFHARRLVALPSSSATVKSGGVRRRSANLSSGSRPETVLSENEQDFAYTFLKNAELPKVEKSIEEATRTKLPPVKRASFLQLMKNW